MKFIVKEKNEKQTALTVVSKEHPVLSEEDFDQALSKKTETLFEREGALYVITPVGVIFNLSGKPYGTWDSEKQRAMENLSPYEKVQVEDMALPHVKPEASSEEVSEMAFELLTKMIEAGGDILVVNEGDSTLTVQLVCGADALGFPCYADVYSKSDHKFFQFRSY